MRIDDRYSASSTSGSLKYPGNRITVYRDGLKVLTVNFTVGNPLEYIRNCAKGKHREKLFYECQRAGIPRIVIMKMINGP